MKQKIVEGNATQALLGSLNGMIKTVFPKLQELLNRSEPIGHLFLEYVRDLVILEHLLNDTYQMMMLSEEPNSQHKLQRFLEERQYLRSHAPQLLALPLNYQWYYRIMEMVGKELQELGNCLYDLLSCVFVVLSKLRVIKQVYGAIVTFDKNDPFQRDYSDPCWNILWTFSKRKKLGPAQQIDESVRSLYKKLETLTAISETSWKVENFWLRTAMEMYGSIVFFLDKVNRDRNNIVFKSHIQAGLGRSVWNRAEMGVVKFFMNFIYPCLGYVTKIYLNDEYEKVTAEAVLRWLRRQSETLNLESPRKHPPYTKQDLFQPDQLKIRVRVMCTTNLQRHQKYAGDEPDDYSSLIYHVHGGGFVALSSRTHQTYTRRWAKNCGAPVFSIDYRKAPQHPYPDGLDDAWQAYNWLLYESHRYFKIKRRKRLILVGDSAGANLIIGITNLCLLTGTPLPYTLVTYYPCVSFDVKRFTPSYVNVINNPMIPYEFLSFCAEAYIQRPEFNNECDYFMQPIYTPLGILSRFPPIHIYQGEKDPLHDHTVRFGLRLKQANAPVTIVLYQSMIHGFLSLDVMVAGIKHADKAVDESIQLLKWLVSQ